MKQRVNRFGTGKYGSPDRPDNANGHRRHETSLEETTKAVHRQNVHPGLATPHASLPSHPPSFGAGSGLSGLFGSSGQPQKSKNWPVPPVIRYTPISSRVIFHVLRFTSPERQMISLGENGILYREHVRHNRRAILQDAQKDRPASKAC